MRLVVAWLSGVRNANVVCSVGVVFNVSVAPEEALSVKSLPATCSDNELPDE